jgi:hypothetical protein
LIATFRGLSLGRQDPIERAFRPEIDPFVQKGGGRLGRGMPRARQTGVMRPTGASDVANSIIVVRRC